MATTPTANAVPSNDVADLLFNAEKFDELINSGALEYLDRLGVSRMTPAGAVFSIRAFNARGPWVTATLYAVKDLVLVSGTWYACVSQHTSGATFAGDSANWRVHQGVIESTLASESSASEGAVMVGVHDVGNNFPEVAPGDRKVEAVLAAIAARLYGVNVLKHGADPTFVADSSAAFAAAAAEASATGNNLVWAPGGHYRFSAPVTWLPRVSLHGVGGHTGTLIEGDHAGNIFQWTNIDFCTFSGLALTGEECTAFRQTAAGANYTQNVTWENNHFYGQLEECIYGNLIFGKIVDNTFGYFGTVGLAHRHVLSEGSATNLSNLNLVRGNRFYNAVGNESLRADSGEGWTFLGNNWEGNDALPVRLNGIVNVKFDQQNFFEGNLDTDCEVEINVGAHVIDSKPTIVRNCIFHPSADVTTLVKINNSLSSLAFDYNTGDITGKTVTNDPTKLVSEQGNSLAGAAAQRTFQLADASGAGLTLVGGLGRYVRTGDWVDLNVAFTYPATASGANAVLSGLPFTAAGVAPLATLSNGGTALVFGVNSGAQTITPFAAGTLTARTNAQMSGLQVYLSGRFRIS